MKIVSKHLLNFICLLLQEKINRKLGDDANVNCYYRRKYDGTLLFTFHLGQSEPLAVLAVSREDLEVLEETLDLLNNKIDDAVIEVNKRLKEIYA